MRKSLALVLFLLLGSSSYALDVPPLRSHVNDYAGMLSLEEAGTLDAKLTDFEKTDSTQIVLLTVPSLGGENLEEFSIKVAEAWRIGQKDKDNGVILLISKQEHKIRIEVGRGLEGKLTDLVSGRIIRNEIAPSFKSSDMKGGIANGVSAIIGVVRGEYNSSPNDIVHGKEPHSAFVILQQFFFLLIGCTFLGCLSRLAAGLGGAIGLPVVAYLSFSAIGLPLLVLLGVIGFGVGVLVAFLNTVGRTSRGTRGRGGIFWGGSGGGAGGGFSGGGGSFGGGGASGSW